MAEPASKPEKPTLRPTDLALLKRIGPYIREDRHYLWLVLLLTPLGVIAEVAQPTLLKIGIDEHIATGDLDGLGSVALVFVGTVFLAWLSASLGYSALQRVALRGLARIRRAIFRHVTAQGARFFDRRHAGSLMTRTINDVDAVYESLARGAIQLLTNALQIIFMLIAMLRLDFQLTVVAFLFSPLIYFVVAWFRRRLRPISARIRETLSSLNGYFAERIFGMTVVQLYGAERVSQTTFDGMSRSYMKAYHQSNWLDAGLYAVMDGMSALAIGAVVWFVAAQVTDPSSALTIGLLVAFVEYLGRIFEPIRELSGQIAMLQNSFAALEKIFGLLDSGDAITPGSITLERPTGEVTLRGVRFRYAPDRPEVLKGIDMEVRPGEVVAVVGATGSGKTTIGKLLLRMYDGYEGQILVDGKELRDIRPESVRDTITVVHQDVWLMEGSIAENVTLGDPRISRDDVVRAGKMSRAAEFVDTLPGGWDYQITERGQNLSTGQRQLLAITRAMARQAPLVILDEATSSVDSMTEKQIDLAMVELFRTRTVIVIAHRLQTIQKADRIVVLHQGEVVEQGSHAELMAKAGRYKVLVETGFEL